MSSTQEKSFEVAIVGGGIAGIILAISLARRNVPYTIYERAHAFVEQGVGLGMTPNAARAMRLCDPAVREAFEKVTERPFEWRFLDGTSEAADSIVQFSLGSTVEGMRGCHRGQFLKRLIELVPEGAIRFGKQLVRVEEPRGVAGRLLMVFDDGTTAETDAVVGCDGIKSTTRAIVVGEDHPSVKCTYTYKYAYRGLVPMAQAVEILGPERSAISGVWVSWMAKREMCYFSLTSPQLEGLEAFVFSSRSNADYVVRCLTMSTSSATRSPGERCSTLSPIAPPARTGPARHS